MKRLKEISLISVLLLLLAQKTEAMEQSGEDDGDTASAGANTQKIKLQKEEKNDETAKAALLSHSSIAIKETEEQEASLPLCLASYNNEEKEDFPVAPVLTISSLLSISTGVYESDDIELILSHPLKHFGNQDFIVFDVDQVLVAVLDPYYFEHCIKKTPLHNRLFSQDQSIIDKFFLYMFVAHPWRIMDERIPSLIERLQLLGINSIANTAVHPTINPNLNVDIPSLRIQILRNFNINFSGTFPELLSWNFDTLEAKHIVQDVPLFKEGVIFSSKTPKHITTLELFKKLGIKPRKVVYIDDILENSYKMYEVLNSQGIECYSFFYTKNKTTSLQRSYFSDEVFEQELKKIEVFLEKLLEGENTDAFFTEIKRDV